MKADLRWFKIKWMFTCGRTNEYPTGPFSFLNFTYPLHTYTLLSYQKKVFLLTVRTYHCPYPCPLLGDCNLGQRNPWEGCGKTVVRAIKKKGHHRVHTLTQIMMMLFLKALHYHYRKLQIMFSVYDGWCIGKKLWVQTEKVLLHGIAVPLAFLDKGYNIFSSCRGGNLWDQIVK